VNESINDEIDDIIAESEGRIIDADLELQRIADDPNSTNLELEKSAHDRESTTNLELDKINSLIIDKVSQANPALDLEDSTEFNSIVVQQLGVSREMAEHTARKNTNSMAKFEFFEKHGED
jgi:E3 ubiquitin-protein ligase DOA10